MYDELIKRLRETYEADDITNQGILLEAADAIEQLIEERDAYRKAMTDEELAEWIVAIIAQETIYSARKVPTPDYAIEMRQRWLDWLRQECER